MSDNVTSLITLRAERSYRNKQSSAYTRILPRGPGKILSILPMFFFKIGHFLVLPPSKLLIITSRFVSNTQILSLLIKNAVSASPRFSVIHLALEKSLSNYINKY